MAEKVKLQRLARHENTIFDERLQMSNGVIQNQQELQTCRKW